MNKPIFGGLQPPDTNKVLGQRGFTSVELMIAVTLLGIILGLAIPSYRAMVEKRQLTQGVEQVFAFLNSVQGIASRSNSEITISYARTANDNWCVGAVLGATACDCAETNTAAADFCAIDGGTMRVTNDSVGNKGLMQAVDGDGAFSFDPIRGLMVNLNDAPEMTMHSPNGDYQLVLSMSNTGHTSICSKDADHSVPGYDVCPVVEEEEES
ncbi:MAG: pilus assembly FimT family protein [Gammaproteobacteria bacterium]